MRHPRQHVLLAHADGELDDVRASAVARHLGGCARCTSMMERQRRTSRAFATALAAVDDAEPDAWGEAPRSRAVLTAPAAAMGLMPASGGTRHRTARKAGRFSGAWRWAAAVVLTTGAAAAAVVFVLPQVRQAEEMAAGRTAPATVETATSPVASVAVRPRDGAIQVLLTGAGDGSRLVLRQAAGGDVQVTVEGLPTPRFAALDGQVAADLGDARVVVRVAMPAALRTATITLDGHVVAMVREGQTSPPEAAADGIELVLPPRQ
jgi:anti-sigma factor RsiW